MDFSSSVAAGSRRIALRRSISYLTSSLHHASFAGPCLICWEASLLPRLLLRISTSFSTKPFEAPERGGLPTGSRGRRGLTYICEKRSRNLLAAEFFCFTK